MNRAESLYEKVKIAQVSLECGGLTPLSVERGVVLGVSSVPCDICVPWDKCDLYRFVGTNEFQSVRPQRPQNFVPEG